MRSIKFRAWHKKDKKWLHAYKPGDEGCNINGEIITTGNWLSEFHGLMDINNVVIEQFTGLKDKNGKDIYEGDIVECIYGKGAIVYEAPKFTIDCGDVVEYYEHDPNLVILGNVHENPELIKEPK